MAPRPDRRVDPLLRPSLAQGRSDRRDRGRRPHRSEEPRLRRDRGDPVAERSLRGSRRRDPLRRSSAPAGRSRPGRARGWRPWPRAPSRSPGSRGPTDVAVLRGGDHPRLRRAVPAPRGASRWDGSRSSCREPWSPGFLFGAAIDVVIGELPKLTGTEVTGSNPLQELRSWFGTLGDAHRATVLVGGVSLVVVFGLRIDRATRPRRPRPGRRRVSWPRGSSISAPAVSPSWRGAEGLPTPEVPRIDAAGGSRRHDRARGGGAGAHRVLADRRRLQDVRGQAPLSHRHQPGIGRPGHGERRRRPVPGNAGLDEPVRELAERPHRRTHRPRLAHLRRRSSCSRCSSWRRCSRICRSRCSPP